MLINRLILLVALFLGQATLAIAAPRFAVFSDDSPTSRQLHQLMSGELRQAGLTEITGSIVQKSLATEPAVSAAAANTLVYPVLNSNDIVIAIGSLALRQILHQTTLKQVIVVLITKAALEEEILRSPARNGREIYAVVLDQPPGRYLDLIRLALPIRQRIGTLFSPATVSQQKVLEKLAAEREMSLGVARIHEDMSLIPQLEHLLTQCDVLLALPDANVHNRNTVQPLLLTTYRAGVPVVAYSEAYAQAGALLALYSTPAQLVRQAVEVAQQLTQGRSVPRIQTPRYFSVSMNASVARSLGLTIPAGEILRDRLQQASSGAE